jgi:hypothetical protein
MSDTEPKVAKAGDIAAFVVTLSPAQRQQWDVIYATFQMDIREARKEANARDALFNAIQEAMGDVTPAQIKRLVTNGIDRGDPQMLRMLSQLGGADLSEKPLVTSGEGAKVIIFKPFQGGRNGKEEVKRISPSGVRSGATKDRR